jgi:hypothetical protein
MHVLIVGFVPLWAASAVFTVLMHKNRTLGTPLLFNPLCNSRLLTERGLWARKWAIIASIAGTLWLLIGSIIGIAYDL